jgi:hypothetical protein
MTSRIELSYHEVLHRTLFANNDNPTAPKMASSLNTLNLLALCNLTRHSIQLSDNFATRQAIAADPSTVRTNYAVDDVPCPVVSNYVELSFSSGVVHEAIVDWHTNFAAELAAATDYGVGVRALPHVNDLSASFVVSLVTIVNDVQNCPPISLPSAY